MFIELRRLSKALLSNLVLPADLKGRSGRCEQLGVADQRAGPEDIQLGRNPGLAPHYQSLCASVNSSVK